jgi:DNA-binding Xre family transcriptional regulator
MQVINQVPRLMAQKQYKENRVISTTEVVTATGLSRATVLSWIKGEVTRFDKDAIIAFCRYFECGVGDLLTLEHDEDKK